MDKDTADGLYATKGTYVTAQGVTDIIEADPTIAGKQDKITFGAGLTYDEGSKTLSASGVSVDLSPYTLKSAYEAKIAELEQKIQQLTVKSGATTDRPAAPVAGQMYYDTDLNAPVFYNGTEWKSMVGGGTGIAVEAD